MTADDRDIRTQRLIASRRRDSADKQRRTLTVIADLSSAGERINISEIARRAGVSPWFIYNTAAIRTAVERATEEHSHTATRSSAGRTSATADSLHAELLMAREEVRALRTDRTKLETKVQLLLGNQLEHLPHDTLLARIHELEQIAAELRSDLDSERRRADTMTTRTEELQDELTAARASLKRMVQSVSPARRIEAIGRLIRTHPSKHRNLRGTVNQHADNTADDRILDCLSHPQSGRPITVIVLRPGRTGTVTSHPPLLESPTGGIDRLHRDLLRDVGASVRLVRGNRRLASRRRTLQYLVGALMRHRNQTSSRSSVHPPGSDFGDRSPDSCAPEDSIVAHPSATNRSTRPHGQSELQSKYPVPEQNCQSAVEVSCPRTKLIVFPV